MSDNTGTLENNACQAEKPEEQEVKCSTCEKKATPCISFFAYENSMMHKDVDNERAHKTTLFVCITFLLVVIIFVAAYTIRMNSFLDTINHMNAAIVELANAKGIVVP